MESGFVHLHNLLRWVVLLFAILSLISGLRGMSGNRIFKQGDKRTAFFFMLSMDIQVVIGLALYFMKDYYKNFTEGNMGEVMKNAIARFWSMEHLLGMIVALIIVHVGYAGTKGMRPDAQKFRRLFWCTLFALLIIAISIPWPWRAAGIARPWFPGMPL